MTYREKVRIWPRLNKDFSLSDSFSYTEFALIYERLDVKIKERGESFYQPMMPGLVEELKDKGSKSPTIIICIPFGLSRYCRCRRRTNGAVCSRGYRSVDDCKIRRRIHVRHVGYGGGETARSRRKGRLAHLRRRFWPGSGDRGFREKIFFSIL